ncbi:hypothetical protein KAFR_0B02420 [Kazachstania africana CBS 2517]|uniref:Uncharacterized protein n=1 Tax=Kazachstania africana (strain ATCC 22294 / BCRC 22015 / CBS 2517 / CECT 1963 / NBRC 1671 / NRRL Y-8276) TaxID=1071382 RepID=H2AQ90_KAZAF|nr:hypothetical protein KAFR_0B02420 [Kazachstania africana CBS 2517]CCF56540.1 hypothetical protein KAFR_0B02420 [Kazachstania africana CBS 2517]
MVKQICTHSGSFHADESLAVYMLRLLPEYKDAKLVRSRDPKDWEESDIVVDVGAQYDGVKYFDHHQREFMETFSSDFHTKLSSAGLVYKHFGKRIIKSILGDVSEEDLDVLYLRVYKQFVEALDANDNGISKYDIKDDMGIKARFNDNAISIPGIISGMNPSWNGDSSAENFDKCFLKASAFIGSAFVTLVEGYGNSWLPAKSLVKEAVLNRKSCYESGEIVILEQFCPWKEHLYEIEKELGIQGQTKFILFVDSSNSWRVSTVPVSSGSFEFRRGLPKALRGLRDEQLSEASGVPGCVFIHAAGFIGGAKTKEAVLQLAKMGLEQQ